MPEWLEKQLLMMLGAGVGAVITIVLTHIFQRSRSAHDRLIDKYCELVGIATSESDRARRVESILAIGKPFENGNVKELLDKLLHERTSLGRELARVCFQIRMLEPSASLREMVEKLAKTQPFLVPGKLGSGNFAERFEAYKREIIAFERIVKSIMDDVLAKHQIVRTPSLGRNQKQRKERGSLKANQGEVEGS
jgi:hypothetical protein